MGKTKTTTAETPDLLFEPEIFSSSQENSDFTSLNTSLNEIRKLEGIIGYIIRNETSAIINLSKPDKITEYALFATQALESSLDIANQQGISCIESVIVEGKNQKALCLVIGKNKISIFAEKSAIQASIIKTILL